MRAYFGEHPVAAFERLNPGNRTDLGTLDGSSLELTRSGAADVRGRAILEDAWDSLVSDGKTMPSRSVSALQAVQAVALVEGGYGNGFGRCPDVKNNWGSTQLPHSPRAPADSISGPQTITCPPASGWCTDSSPDDQGRTSWYQVCFESFDSPRDGARNFLRRLLIDRPTVAAVIGGGSADAIAMAMYDARYYQGFGKTKADRVAHYADGIAARAKQVATSLAEPWSVLRSGGGVGPIEGPTSGASLGLKVAVGVGAGVVLVGAGVLGWYYGEHHGG